jgi:hypothetical protein
MPARKEAPVRKAVGAIQIELVRADVQVIDPRDGRAQNPLVICVLSGGSVLNVRLAFERDLKRGRRGL